MPVSSKIPTSSLAPNVGILPGAAAELIVALRLPADSASYAAVSALLGENLPLETRTAQALRRFTRLHNDDPAAARIAARAMAAGLDTEGAAVQKVLEILDPADSGGTGSSAGHGGFGNQHDDPGAATPAVATTVVDEAEMRDLADKLRDAASAAMKDPDLQQMAVRKADGSAWACIPFNIPFAGIIFHGFFRILYYGTVVRAVKLVADIRFGRERRLLELSGAGPDTVMAYHADDERECQAFDAEFSHRRGIFTSSLSDGDYSELLSRWSIDEDA